MVLLLILQQAKVCLENSKRGNRRILRAFQFKPTFLDMPGWASPLPDNDQPVLAQPMHLYLNIDSPDESNRILANMQDAGVRDNNSETGVKRPAALVYV